MLCDALLLYKFREIDMIEIKVSLDMIDYSSLLPIITKTVTKNKLLSKAIKLTVD